MHIYLARNLINGKLYVGQTRVSIEVRWKQHLQETRRGCNFLFHKAVRKHGIKAFTLSQLSFCRSQKDLDRVEMDWITRLSTMSPHGYNTKLGKQGHPSDDVKKRVSLSLKGRLKSEETKARMRAAKKGQIPWSKGRKMSASSSALKSVALTGIERSEETRKKMSAANIGRVVSKETREKIRATTKGRAVPLAVREAGWKANRGRKRSEDTRAKLRAAWVLRKEKIKLCQ